MRLVYFDEAGSSKHEAQEPILTVAAIVIHGDLQTLPIERDAMKIVETIVPEEYRVGFEFHAKDLFSSDKYPKWPGNGPKGRYAVLGEFINLINKYSLPVLEASIEKAGFWYLMRSPEENEGNSPHFGHQVAFQFCAVSVEDWFRRNAASERGLCIADETKARPALRRGLKRYRDGVEWDVGEANPWRIKLDHLVDTVYFGNSHESVLLQLADMCAFFTKRKAMGRANSERFYEIIRPQLVREPKVLFRGLGRTQ